MRRIVDLSALVVVACSGAAADETVAGTTAGGMVGSSGEDRTSLTGQGSTDGRGRDGEGSTGTGATTSASVGDSTSTSVGGADTTVASSSGDDITTGGSDTGDVALAPEGIYVVDQIEERILRFDTHTGQFAEVYVDNPAFFRPTDVTFGPDGALYVANFDNREILRVDSGADRTISVFYRDGDQDNFLQEPIQIEFYEGLFYILGGDTHNMVTLDAEGNFVSEFARNQLRGCDGFDFSGDGRMAVICALAEPFRVQGWTLNPLELYGGINDPQLGDTQGGRFADDGLLYVADWENSMLVAYDPDNGMRVADYADEVVIDRPTELEINPVDRQLYITSQTGVARFSTVTHSLQLFIPIGSGGLDYPRGFAFR